MNITIASIFVNSMPYIQRYLAQCVALSDALIERGDKPTFLWGEGDSTDHTRRMLEAMRWRLNSRVVDVTHGGQIFGSVVREERFRQLALVGRKLWAEVPAECDVVLWVESDLIWSVETTLGLIDALGMSVIPDARTASPDRPRLGDINVIAPPILLDRPGWGTSINFYDTFGFRCQGRHFEHRPPYHPANDGRSLLEMETVGSMVAMQAEHFRRAAATYDERVMMGMCEDIRKNGGRVWFDPRIKPAIHQ